MKKTVKRIISAFLAVLTVMASFVFAPVKTEAAGESCGIRFNSKSTLSLFSNANNLNVTYSDSEDAVLLAVTGSGADPYVLLNVEASMSISADAYKYVVVTYRTPVTNSAKAAKSELFMSAGSITAPTGGYSVTFQPVNGYKYRSQIIDMSSQSYWTGTVHSIRVDAFAEGSLWDAFYLSSVTFCSSSGAASAAASEESARADGLTAGISETALSSSSYSLDTYVETEYWKGNIVYNESVYPLLNADGTMSPIPLMYDAKRIVCVRDGTLGTEYKYGTDYIISDGKLVVLTTGNIPTIKYSDYRLDSAPADTTFWQPCRDGSYVYFCEGAVFHRAQLAVTYTHEDVWTGPVPESKVSLLPKTVSKLQNKEQLTVVFNGDSITYGANASGLSSINVAPKTPLWADMTIAGLKSEYGYTNINYANTAVGGKTSSWGAENAYENIAKYVPDLVFIAFGVNDGTLGVAPADFKANIQSIMASVRAVNPDCEFVLVASIIANPITYFSGSTYIDVLLQLQGDGVAVADMTSIHKYLLETKKYADMTGNNVNHPNDFLIRFYAQTMLAALSPSELESFKESAAAALGSYADESLYLDAEKAVLREKLAAGIAAINACESESAVSEALAAAKREIDNIKTAAEYEAENLDYTKLTFNSAAALATVKSTNNVSAELDYTSDAAAVTVTGSDPWLRISYPDKAVSADVFRFAVIVYKIPSEAASSFAQLFFTVGSVNIESEDASAKFTPVKGSYNYQVIDLSGADFWSGDLHSIRIDPFAAANTGDVMYLHSVCLFDSSAEAEEYGAKAAGVLSGVYIGNNEYASFTTEADLARISADGNTFELGDLNGDGKISSPDLIAIRRHLAGTDDYSDGHPDLNGDGKCSIRDSLQLKRIIMGYSDSPGVYSTASAVCSYSETYKSAKISAIGGCAPTVKINVSDKLADSSGFKYVTLTFLMPEGEASKASVYLVTQGGASGCVKTFEITPTEEYQSVTLDFSSAADLEGRIEELVFSFAESASAGAFIYLDGVVLSDTASAAERARSSGASAANRQAGKYTPVTGQNVIPLNDVTTMATYAYYNGVSGGDTYTYTSQLIISPDRQPDEKFDRFSLTYTSSTLARGVITYVVNGIAAEDEFYLEAASSANTFTSLINGYFNGSEASEIVSIVIYPVSASSSQFSLKAITTENYVNYSGTVYLENSQVKMGVYLDMGGGISHYEKKDDNNENYTNLLNCYDVGRLIQQSYYGIDKDPYVLGNMGGTPWRYNPVQGGDVANNPSRIIDIQVGSSSVYVKVRPMDWGHDGHITPSYMENLYTLYDSFAKVDNRFVDFSGYTHTLASQELPAFYTVSALRVFNMYNGDSPWTDAAYSSYPNLDFWAGNSSQNYALKSTSEYWYAFTDVSGFGIGLYVPNVTNVLAGRFLPDIQSCDPNANATCYFAPLRQMTLKSGKALTYSYLICAGDISTIRNTFKNNRTLINNSALSAY